MFHHFRTKLKDSAAMDVVRAGVSVVRHLPVLMPFLLSGPRSRLNRYLRSRPEILEMVHTPYLAACWDASTRMARLRDHLETVTAIGGIVDMQSDDVIDLVHLNSIGPHYRLTLDQARWLLREGQLVLSLWDGIDRIFSLSFSLSTQQGKRVAYVGGIQGRQQVAGEPDILERYKLFTKASFGTRPRDFLVEAFKMLCRAIDVTEIIAVSDANHPTRTIVDGVKLSYDQIWLERGGTTINDGFFSLPVTIVRKDEEDIPAKKRPMYRKRFAMFAEIETTLADNLRQNRPTVACRSLRDTQPEIIPSRIATALRTFAFAGALLVLFSAKFFGGSWMGFAIGLFAVCVANWLLKGNISKNSARRIAVLRKIQSLPLTIRLGCAGLIVGADIVLDFYFGGFGFGKALSLYLIPIFFTSIFLGGGVAIPVWLCCLAALYYLDIPPRLSLAIDTIEGVIQLLVFCVLAAIAFVIPKLLLTAADLATAHTDPRFGSTDLR